MISRPPEIHVAFRIGAVVTVAFWLLATSYCSVEHLLGFDHHGNVGRASSLSVDGTSLLRETGGRMPPVLADKMSAPHLPSDTAEHSDGEDHYPQHAQSAHHSHDAEGHSPGSHHHDSGGDACCSRLQACVYVGQPIIISAPVVHPLPLFSSLLQAHASALIALGKASDRPPPDHDWVFTPEVCTGPANRPHGPPASV